MRKNETKTLDKLRQQKSQLSILKKKGLYKPKNPRGPVTDYGKSLLHKFSDVISGKSAVVTVRPDNNHKGNKAAAEYKTLASSKKASNAIMVKGNKIIVPYRKEQNERVVYNKKSKRVEIRRASSSGTYIRSPLKHQIHDINDIPKIDKNTVFSVPFNRGTRIDYQNFTYDDFVAFYSQYGIKGSKREYKNLGTLVSIFEYKLSNRKKKEPDVDYEDVEVE